MCLSIFLAVDCETGQRRCLSHRDECVILKYLAVKPVKTDKVMSTCSVTETAQQKLPCQTSLCLGVSKKCSPLNLSPSPSADLQFTQDTGQLMPFSAPSVIAAATLLPGLTLLQFIFTVGFPSSLQSTFFLLYSFLYFLYRQPLIRGD